MKNLYLFIVSLLFKKTDNVSFVPFPHTSRVGLWLHSLLLILVFSGSLSATCTTCTGNLLINPGFDVNVNSWASYNGNFFRSTAYPQCGTAAHAEIIHTTGWAGFYQDVTNIPVGNQVTLTFWAGVHNNSVNSLFGLEFYNGSTYLSESTVQIDKILGGSPSMQFYTVTAIVPSNTTKVRVIGKINGDYLKADELCLKSSVPCNNFKSLASSELNLVKTRQVSNEITCVTQPDRVLWMDCILDNSSGGTSGNLKFWHIISGGTFKEYCDGTAYLEMTVQNVANSNYKFDVAISFSGRTFTTPSGSPHLEGCTSATSSNWYYYTEMKGSLIGQGGLSGGNISFDRKMASFQIGTNASLYGTSGSFGASGWFMYNVLSNPTGFNFKEDCGADLNFFLSGGNLTSAQASVCGKVCAGAAVTLDGKGVGGKPSYTYSWSNGLGSGQTKTVNPTTTTTYTVTITDNLGCTSSDAVTININNSPTVNAGADATICTGSSIILTASGSGGLSPYTYIWNNGLGAGASKTVSPTSNTTYIVTVTDANGCTATDNVTVNIGASPTLTATGTTICSGGSGTISASASGGVAPYTYYWSNGLGTGATKTVNPTVNTTYTVTVEDGNGCTKTATATVTIGGGPTVNVGPDINLCTMDEEIINSTVSNVPSCGQSGTSDCNHVIQGTTGWIEGTASAGVCGDNAGSKLWTQSGQGTSSVTLDFGTTVPIGTVICVRMKLEHCQNTNSSLADAKIQRSTSATSGYTDIVASKTFTTTTYTEYCYTLTAASRYIKVLDNGKCAFRVDYVKYTTPDTYNNSITYAWTGPGIVGSTTGASIIVNQSGTYTLVVTDCGGCTASDQVVVTGNGNVNANAGPDQILCSGQSVTLSATEVVGASYEWRTELNGNIIATTRTVSVSPTIATSYILKVTKNGCEATDAVLVTVNPAPTVNVGPDINLCTMDEEIINSTVSNVPSCGQSGTSDCNHVIQGTTGWIEGTASAGVCGDNAGSKLWTQSGQGTSSVTLDFGTTVPIGTVICVRMKLEHCQNTNSSLADAKIQRSTSATSGYTDIVASKTFTTTTYTEYCYTLTAASRYIKVLDNGKCAFRVDYVKYTTPDTYNNSITYAWTGPGIVGSTTGASIIVNQSGTYTLVVTDCGGCTASDQVVVTGSGNVNANAGPDQILCSGQSVTLSATEVVGASYEWRTELNGNVIATTRTVSVSPTIATSYILKVTKNGCEATDAVLVTVNPAPTVNVGPDINLCTMDEEIINSTVSNVPSCGQSGTSDCNHVVQGTTGWIEGSASAGICGDNAGSKLWTKSGQGTSSVTLDFGTTVPEGTVICVRMKLEHCQNSNSNQSDAKIQRSTSATSGYTDIIASKTFTTTTYVEYCYTLTTATRYVKVSDNGKCAFRVDYVKYTTPDTYNNSVTYAWSGPGIVGSTSGASIIVNQSGTYTLVVTDCGGCTASDQVVVTGNGNVEANAGPDQTICTGNSVTLTATEVVGATYEWRSEASETVISNTRTVSVSPTATTSYIVKVMKNGCENSDAVTVNVNSKPTAEITGGNQVCTGSSITLVASGAGTGGSYLWSTNATSSSITVSPSVNTTYVVTVTNANGCSNTASKAVTVNPLPTVVANNDGPITCVKSNITLTATSATAVTYAWSGPSGYSGTGATASPLATVQGQYTVAVTDANGCIATASTTITQNITPPTANAGADVTVNCTNPSATLTASGGTSYLWSTGATTASITVSPNVTTTYSVTVTGSNGCTASDAVIVTANKTAPTAAVTANGNNCITENAQLFGSASGGTAPYTYAFTGPNGFSSTDQNPLITQNGTYTLVVTDANGCTDDIDIVIFTQFDPFVITVATDICVGESVTLTASGGVSFQWDANGNNATTNSITVSPLVTTTYAVTITNQNGCVATADATITVFSKPVITNVVTTPNASCNNTNNSGSITVSATGQPGLTLQYRINGGAWQTSNVFNNLPNGSYNVEVSYTNRFCVSIPAQATIQSGAGPVAVAENDKSVCVNAPFNLTASATGATPPYTFAWSNNMTGSNITVNGINSNTTYTVTVTDALGCTGTDNVSITIIPGPVSGITGPPTICANEPALFVATPAGVGSTYLWTFDSGVPASATGSSATSQWLTPGEYGITLTVTKNGCISEYTSSIAITQSVFAAAGPDAELCQGGNITLNGSGPIGANFTWTVVSGDPTSIDNGGSTSGVLVSPLITTTYRLTVTQNGCTRIDEVKVVVDVNYNPIANAGTDRSLCDDESYIIGGNPTGIAPPQTPNAPLGYIWSPSTGLNNATIANPTLTVNNPGNYNYQVIVFSTLTGCSDTATVNFIVNPRPTVTASASPSTICIDESSVLTAVGAGGTQPYTYAWSNGLGSGASKTVSPTATTTYTVTITDFNGCTASTTVTVTVNPRPTVTASASPSTICIDESSVLTAVGAGGTQPYTYAWSNGLGSGASKTVSPTATTTYTVTITDFNGCTASTTVTVTVNPRPTVTASASPSTICIDESSVLTAVGAGGTQPYTYAWSNGLGSGASKTVSPTATTTYTVTITDFNGCTASTAVTVTVNPRPTVTAIASPSTICIDESSVLTAVGAGGTQPYTYAWSNGLGSGASKTVSPLVTTTYTVTITDYNGCTASTTVTVTVNPRPTVTASASPSTICIDESSVLTAVGAGGTQPYTYAWSNGLGAGASKTVSPTATTTYTVTITDYNGCTASTTVTVTVNPRPTVTASASPSTICIDESSVLTAVGAGGTQPYTYAWSNGLGAGASKTVSPLVTTTSYTVTITDYNGCTASTTVTVTVNPRPTVTASASPSTICIDESSVLTAIGAGGTQPYTYAWSNGLGSGASKTVSPTATTTYTVTITDFNGCTASTTVTVTVNPRPTVTASASPSTICIDESSVLTAVGAGGTQPYTYAWSNGLGSGASKTVSPTATTTYTVTITDYNGCTASTTVTVTVNPRPTVTASASPSTICIDESSVLTAVGAGGTQPYTYAWSNGLGAGASKTVSPTATTTYTVTITDYNGCTASTTVTVTVNPRPTVTASASPSTICIDESSVLTAVGAGGTQPYTYAWSNGLGAGASKTVSPLVTTTYTVTITDYNGCTASTTVAVTVESKAKVGDFVWEDKNANGIQDLNEIGIGNVPVSIYDANSNILIDQTNTLGNGYYEFNVCKGTYYIVFGEYSNYFRTFADKGSDLSDSDANQTTGRTENFTLNPSDNNTTIDAGYYKLASIGDFVWEDIDANGVQGMLENGVPNVEVSITGILNTTNSMGLPILVPPSILLTGPNGEYLFTNLIPGRYTVVVNKPDGYLFSPKDQDGDDAKDSDSDPVTGVMPEETLESGENNLTYDAGIYPEINLEINKTFVSALVQPNGTYNVTYNVEVINTGGPGKYDLKDTPAFDDDININSSSFTSTANGNAGGALAGSGPWTLANDQQIVAFSSHNYSLVVNVTLDLTNGIGNNVYTKCGSSTQLPLPGEGLYNKASVDTNNDGIPEDEDDACGDLPNITLVKDFVSATINSNASYNVTYKITVSNTGGASGVYTLTDTPLFDNDVTINDWSYFFKDVNGGLEFGSAFPGAPVGPANLGTYTITASNTHEFILTFNVNMDLKAGSTDGGDNVYTACSVAGNGPGSSPNQGLYNLAQLDRTGDNVPDISDDACGDLPNITLVKDFVSATINNDGTHRVIYKITVANTGGASGNYTLKDSPLFDDDITINAWDYTFVDVNAGFGNGPSFIGSPVIPINFGTKTLTAGNSHIYTLGFNVTIDLATGSTDGGNNIYTPCAVPGNESGSAPNQGLYNLANVDLTGNGMPNLSDDACGDLPNVTMVKNFVNATPNANGSYNVTYLIVVNNNGGAVGTYSLKDTPLFDNDVVINSGTYSGQASGSMNTSGFTTLANAASINAGSTHTYNVNFNVTLNLAIGSSDGGDNIYTSCEVSGNGPGSAAGQGLYNKAELDKTGDGLTDITDDACGDLPNVTMVKNFVSATPNANGSYNVTYQIVVNNNGGATGTYGLKDTPLFDNDVVINSGSYSGQASGALNTTGSTTLASNASILAGANHTYDLTFNVTLDLNAGSTDGGDNVYTACSVAGNGPGSSPLQGLYNRAELDRNNDGVTDLTDDACGDLPNVTLQKQFLNAVQIANGTYNVTYKITVNNTGGTSGSYSLKDTPLFDKDIAINSGSYTGQASGTLNTVGSTTLASNQSIASGASHVYNINYNVTLDIANDELDGGDNVYNPCDLSSSDPTSSANKGLYNKAELDRTGDGIVDVSDDACGDLPGSIGDFVWEDTNANGVQDFGETGIPNVIVRLLNQDGVQIAFKVTGPNGAYIFNNLPPATYRVRFDKPMNFIATDMNKGANPTLDSNADPITGFTELIPLAPGEDNLTIDAGYYKLAKIGDFVWEDRNSNGLQDPLEPGISNVTVELTGTDARGTVINTSTTTNGIGFYEFANLLPGTYVVRFVKPGDLYKPSPANVEMDDAKDSDASVVNGQTGTILLKSGENNNTIDAGFFRCAYVGDYVWLDDNGTNDYVQDGSDVGLNGILVELYSTANPATPVQSMLTIDNPKFPGQKGYYNFEVCQVGTYFIKVIKPEIYEYVQPNMGLDDSKDSDIIDFLNQSTLTFTVNYAAIIDDIDAGLKSKPLPVELLDFTGRYNSNKDVNELTWATASEVNNDYFEIERSFEGRAFESVGVVEGKGNSASRVSYDFTDKDIELNGVYTYRLRQVDFDGRFEYSNLVNIEVSRKGVVKTAIYPNPSVSDVNLDIYAVEGAEVKVDIYDNLGKLVIQGFIDEVMTANVKTSKIESGRLNEGVYYIVVNVDGELSTHKLIIIE